LTNKELREKIEKLETKYNEQFKVVFKIIKKLIEPVSKEERRMGFVAK
jgi:hypothetical protein